MFLDYNLDVEKQSVWKIAHPTSEAMKYPFVVNESGVFYAGKDFFTKRYAKNDYQILYTISGAAELDYNGRLWRLGEGSLVIINCNQYHDYRTDSDTGHWAFYWIHTGGTYCEKYYDSVYGDDFHPYVLSMDNELISCFEETLSQIDYTTDAAYIRMSNAVSSVFTKLIMFINSTLPSAQETIVQEMISYIQSHYYEPFNTGDLARRANLSKYYLIKLFNKHTRMTPYHYLILYRMNEAKKLLRTTDYKINDIARSVGFADVSNFSRTFTKLIGVTPGKYRGS